MSTPEFDPKSASPTDIAIVGMAGRFPGAQDIDSFWRLIESGESAVKRLSSEELSDAGVPLEVAADPDYVPVVGVLDDVEGFDAAFFDIGPRDAALMDPQHRHFLEICWQALEDAGHPPSRFEGSIGVYAGSGMNGYMVNNLLKNEELIDSLGMFLVRHTSNDKDFLSTGVSYRLNLRGPSVNVQTACSTSLVATHLASQALISGECDMALAGGVTIEVPHGHGYLHREGEILARDGVCRAFDGASTGTVLTSGAGAVVLRRLSDALAEGDHIYAVIKATAVNNDGAGKVGYLAPSVEGHAAVVAEAQELAGITADSITYIEAHGTGTAVGDPIEVAALTQAFRRTTEESGFCRIGSTKPNIGHLDTAAGVASLMKTSLALERRVLPPMANHTGPNPLLNLDETPFVLSAEATMWPDGDRPRRAGVSSLGVGGTNAHVILEQAPKRADGDEDAQQPQVLVLSAKSEASLERMRLNLAQHLRAHPELSLRDVAYTLREGREAFLFRTSVVAQSSSEAADRLEQPSKAVRAASETPSVVFMFPGMGSQYPNMGRGLYVGEPEFKRAFDTALDALEPGLGATVRSLIFPEAGDEEGAAEALERPSLQLPAIVAVEFALARLLQSWGFEPVAVTGHSLGEYTAACIAGVFSVEDMMRIVSLRGLLMERVKDAAVLSVALPQERVQQLIATDLSLAAVNAPELCVVSGARGAIERFEETLRESDVSGRRLKIAGAVHCGLLDPHLAEFARGLGTVRFSAPRIPYISNVTGTWVGPEDACSPAYWVKHLRETVWFADGLQALLDDPNKILIEVGPGTTLSALARVQPTKPVVAIPTLPHPADAIDASAFIRDAVGKAWCAGAEVNWSRLSTGGRTVSLPAYPFERTRHWIEPKASYSGGGLQMLEAEDWTWRTAWRRSDLVASAETLSGVWLAAGDGKDAEALRRALAARGATAVAVVQGERFERPSAHRFEMPLDDRAAWAFLAEQYVNSRTPVTGVLWAGSSRLNTEDSWFYGPVAMLQALADASTPLKEFAVVARRARSVSGERSAHPYAALAEGPVKVAGREFPETRTRFIDIDRPASTAAAAVIDEIAAGSEQMVGYRGGQRWVRETEPVRLPPSTKPGFRQDGSYVITGGLGGLGLSLAAYLAYRYQAKLTLVSRTNLPPRDEWDAVLGDDAAPAVAAIRAIVAMEEAGAVVQTFAKDIADDGAAREVLAGANLKYGGIDAVLHAAGVMEDAPLLLKTRADMERVLRSKVRGTSVLLDAAAEVGADHVVLFSSIAAELGIEGQVDYAAANAFLDACADAARGSTTRVVSVPFSSWASIGMGARQHPGAVTSRRGPLIPAALGLTADAAWPLFDKAVGCDMPLLGLSPVNIEALRTRAREFSAPPAEALVERSQVLSAADEPRDPVEERLCDIWSRSLGIAQIGIHDDFFEMGGHSLIALRMVASVQAEFGVKLPLTVLYEKPSVAALATMFRSDEPHASADATTQESRPGGPSVHGSSLVTFNSDGSETSFFCVHGMFGGVMNFKDLGDTCAERRPFIGVQQHGLDGSPSPYRTIEAMAAAYLIDIRDYQPHGPYLLGGYSVGGILAFEMARQLIAAGERVERVVMLDTWGPTMVSAAPRRRTSRLFRRLWTERLQFVAEKWRAVRPTRVQSPLDAEWEALAEVSDFSLGELVVNAARKYDYATVDADLLLVNAMREPFTRYLPRDYGWKGLARSIEIREVETFHLNMCQGTNARRVMAAVDEALA